MQPTFRKAAALALTGLLLTGAAARAETPEDLAARSTANDPDTAASALMKLGNLGPKSARYRRAMVLGLMRYNESVRRAASRALKLSGGGAGMEVYPFVVEATPYARRNAAVGYGDMGKEGVPPLIKMLVEDEEASVRRLAARVLSKMGDAAIPAVPTLRLALEDPDDSVRVAAKSALSLLTCSDPLLPTLSERRCFIGYDR